MIFSDLQSFARAFRNLIDQGDHFLILTHVKPDGDAYGSTLALAHALKAIGKKVTLWSDDELVERYSFLPGSSEILTGTPPSGPFSARLVLDNAVPGRVGKIGLQPLPDCPVVNIDHHSSNPGYGDWVWIDSQKASCGEIVFEILKEAQLPISPESAQCLFVAISTDTGSFQYPAVTADTFSTAAELIRLGVDVGKTSQLTYESHPARRLLLTREVLQSVQFDSRDRLAYFWIDAGSYERSGAKPEDTEGLIDLIRSVRSVVVAVLFEELSESSVRISFRSKDPRVNVSQIAQQFGGGGHILASGARLAKPRAETEKAVLDAIRLALKALPE